MWSVEWRVNSVACRSCWRSGGIAVGWCARTSDGDRSRAMSGGVRSLGALAPSTGRSVPSLPAPAGHPRVVVFGRRVAGRVAGRVRGVPRAAPLTPQPRSAGRSPYIITLKWPRRGHFTPKMACFGPKLGYFRCFLGQNRQNRLIFGQNCLKSSYFAQNQLKIVLFWPKIH